MKNASACAPLLILICLSLAPAAEPARPAAAAMKGSLFARENLVAWCIVPFDAKQRGPKERAEMLDRLGIKRVAYDWRDNHVPQWDEELDQYKAHAIELVGFWAPARHKEILELFRRHGVRSQLWVDGSAAPATGDSQEQRVASTTAGLAPIAKLAKEYGCTVGLYNHGGWFGEPENMVAIVERLRADGLDNVGIVYNLHHGASHVERFPELLARMKLYLLCVNLNGMKKSGPMILPVGQGDDDLKLLRTIRDSGYQGPIGILNHQEEVDAEQGLKQNIDGLEKLISRLGGK
jgi:sugar phosphate isomerase/epimerase